MEGVLKVRVELGHQEAADPVECCCEGSRDRAGLGQKDLGIDGKRKRAHSLIRTNQVAVCQKRMR